jgi:hypothetical protein
METLLSGDISSVYSNRPTSIQVWELFTFIVLNATDLQKREIYKELRYLFVFLAHILFTVQSRSCLKVVKWLIFFFVLQWGTEVIK